ncbi:Protein mlp1 [Malassezia nana]|uniref:Protein mlp1 n=1 Tax=Malassezia nana TaxID=180528 RepID=A0AAF0EKE0_9BASI|nr:Protein mlp1 [Malassezia nana]
MSDLEARVAALENEKHKLLEQWQKEREENARRQDELVSLQQRHQSVRSELASTALALERATAGEYAIKFRTHTLEQEVALAQKEAEWARTELAREHEAAAKTRADLHTRLVQAESERSLATQARESSAEQLIQVERLLTDTQARHSEATHTIAELRTRLSEQESEVLMERAAAKQSMQLADARVERAELRAAELESSYDALVHECAARERSARNETEEVRAQLEALEEDRRTLQEALERMATAVGVDTDSSLVSTPSRTASFAKQVMKDDRSFSDVYVDLVRTQEELRRQRTETGRLEGVLAEVMADLDAHAPQLKAQRDEVAQLRAELDTTTEALEEAHSERDLAERTAHDVSTELERLRREHNLTMEQLEDASAQVRTLLRETIILKDPSAAERLAEDAPAEISDIQDVITEELVTFRSLSELCAQNARLVQAVRELGHRLEERDPRDDELQQAADMLEKVSEELRQQRQRLVDVEQERDVYKSVCHAKGLDTSSTVSEPPPAPAPVPETPPAILADLQREAAARAAAEARVTMLQEAAQYHDQRLNDALAEAGRIHAVLERREAALGEAEQALAVARSAAQEAQTRLATRDAEHRLLSEQRDRLLDENAKLGLARAEAEAALRESRFTDEAKGEQQSTLVDQLRQELAHRQAAQAAAEVKLSEAKAEASHATLRRDMETRELRERLDSLSQQHASVREALAAAQADAQHHERRIADLLTQLEHARGIATLLEKQHAAAEESRRVAVAAALGGSADTQLSPEKQWEMELADVRRGRAAAEADTLAAKAALEDAKSTQARLEAELSQAQQAQAEAQSAHEAAMAEQVQAVADAQAKQAEAESQRAAAEAASAKLQSALQEQGAAHAAEKRELEDALAGLQAAETQVATEETSAWDEVRKFSLQAKEASARADEASAASIVAAQELEAARAEVQRLRDEAEKARVARDVLAADHNRAMLELQEKMRTLEKATEEQRTQRDELQQRNDQLHAHLEGVSRQVAALESGSWEATISDVPAQGSEATPAAAEGHATPSTGELQVIRYLRREKEQKVLQLELAQQERARLEQVAAKTAEQLAACRAELKTQRETVQAPNLQCQELLDKIHQLSTLREQVATLTEGKQAVESRNQILEKELAQAKDAMQPYREQLQHTQVELETVQTQLRVVQDDVQRWKTRASGLLKSSGVEEEMKKADKERTRMQEQVQAAKAELESETTRLSSELQAANKKFEQLREQVRARITQERRAVAEAVERANQLEKDMAAQASAAEEEKKQLQAQLKAAETEPTEDAKTDTTQLEEQLKAKTEECEKHKHFARTFLKDKRAAEAQVQALTAELEALRAKKGDNSEATDPPPATATETPSTAPASQEPKNDTTEAADDKQTTASAPTEAEIKTETPTESDAPTAMAPEAAAATVADLTPKQVAALRARIAELETLLSQAQARIAELEKELADTQASHASALAAKEAELETLRQGPEAAIAAKESELQAHYQSLLKSRYEDGKREAALRSQIMVSQRDKKITNLTNEINELKAKLGESVPPKQAAVAPAPTKEAESTPEKESPAPARPAVVRGAGAARGARGGAAGAPKPVPIRPAAETGTSIRGTAKAGRGGAPVAGGSKRKRELNASTSSESEAKASNKPASSKKSKPEKQGDGK